MTKPTQAQIEAALAEFEDELTASQRKLLTAEICRVIAAAEAGNQKDWRGMYLRDTSKLTDQILAERAATIERCAQVALNTKPNTRPGTRSLQEKIAAAIRALKEKP